MQGFKPVLGSNEVVDLDNLEFPIIGLYKYDGIRGEFTNKERLLSRELKQIPQKKIREHPAVIELLKYAKERNKIIDAELYIHGIPFNEHVVFIMSKDIDRTYSLKIKKMLREKKLTNPYNFYMRIPSNFTIRVFDIFDKDKEYLERLTRLAVDLEGKHPQIQVARRRILWSPQEVKDFMDLAISEGYEGIVLRTPKGRYKTGRSTLREQIFLKLKPYREFTGTVIAVNEKRKNMGESFESNLGYAVKSKQEENMVTTGIAATVTTVYLGETLKVTLTGTEESRREIFENKENYIGKSFKYSGMLYGAKSLPRHSIFIEWI